MIYYSGVFLLCQLLSIITSKDLSNENINTLCFQRNDITKIVHFGILIHVLSLKQQKHQFLFLLMIFFDESLDVVIDDS